MKSQLFAVLFIVGCAGVQRQDIVNHVDSRATPIAWVDNLPRHSAGEVFVGLPKANPGDCLLMIVWAGNDGEEHPLGMSVWIGSEARPSVEYGRYNFAVMRVPADPGNQNLAGRLPGVMLVGYDDVYLLAYKVQDSACNRGYYSDQE